MEQKNKKQQIDETNELSDYGKELTKPENIVGEFTDTKEMLQKLLEDNDEFSVRQKYGKFAIYSNKREECLTDYIFDEIAYIKNGNFFVVRKKDKVLHVSPEGFIMNTVIKYPQDFRAECLYREEHHNSRFIIVSKSKHFIYFVTEEDTNDNWCLKIAAKDRFSSKFKKAVVDETAGYKVILKIILSIPYGKHYMRFDTYKDSPYKYMELERLYRNEIRKIIKNTTGMHDDEEIPLYDYAITAWEDLNDKERFFQYETPKQLQAWSNTPISKRLSGLAMNVELVLLSMGKIENEPPYIYVQNDYEDRHNLKNWVKVGLDGKAIGDKKLIFEEHELRELKSWIDINKLTILMYWTQEEFSSFDVIDKIRTITAVYPKASLNFNTEWESKRIIHAKPLEKYFNSIKDKIIGKTIDKIFYTGLLYNRMWDEYYEYDNGEWYQDGKKVNEPSYYPWKTSDTFLELDSPVILDFEGTRLEIMYWSGSLVNVNTNSIDLESYSADVSKHFSTNIIGHKLVDIKINKTKKVYFMNFDHLGIERNDGDDMFEQIWFIFDNGYVLELTTDHTDYTEFCELPPYVYYNFIREVK